ncbi:FAS-associated death domain protein [Halichoeres trimaculatus]|uniref:FAS-associated death domain protein n=1 Tax=Halichoeres trimaculatus TaxID=147232 RepID=UPI003D9E371B
MSSFPFKTVLLEISNSLSPDQLAQLKFLCQDDIGKRDLERIDSGLKLFQFLTERQKLSEDNPDYVCERLMNIGRSDLCERLRNFTCPPVDTEHLPSEQETVKLNIATEVIVENLGRNWRKLGRKLGLNDTKLESISRRHPTELEETAAELLKEWRKSRGAEARTEDLITALRACSLNLTADNIEDKLNRK